jgi:hypothetical protein
MSDTCDQLVTAIVGVTEGVAVGVAPSVGTVPGDSGFGLSEFEPLQPAKIKDPDAMAKRIASPASIER